MLAARYSDSATWVLRRRYLLYFTSSRSLVYLRKYLAWLPDSNIFIYPSQTTIPTNISPSGNRQTIPIP